ncbi:MAG: cohesin domain-containing protein [Bacteroidia bacterium]|nr:cohesin domain-containing protein [Bacteroidia bacterium]
MKSLSKILAFLIFFVGLSSSIQAQNLTFNVGTATGDPGDTVTVAITVTDFTNIAGYQGTIRWDSSILVFEDLSSPSPSIGNFFGRPGQGIIPLDAVTFSWVDFSGGTTNLVNGTAVIEITFIIKNNAPSGVSPVSMNGSVTSIGYTQGSVILTPGVNQGSVTVNSQGLVFNLANVSGNQGDTVEVPLTVNDFISIHGYQGTIRWDSSQIRFFNLSSPNPGISNIFGNPGQGLIPLDAATFTWVDFVGTGITRPNGDTIISISFIIKANATPGVVPVTLDSSVTNLAYSDGVSLLPIITNQGSVTVIGCIPTADPGFLFPSSTCINSSNPSAIVTGDLGGTFSVDNGASIDAITGVLDLSTTSANVTYTVSYTVGSTCPVTSSQTIQILAVDDASFILADSVCVNSGNPIPIVTGFPIGSFAVNNGASINAGNGILDLSTTTPGTTYEISYTTSGSCPNTSIDSIYIRPLDDASFTMVDSICVFDFNPVATITGLAGGTFSVDNGATIDPGTGELSLSTTTVGAIYQITYQTNGPCPSSSSRSIRVTGVNDATFTYPSELCPGAPNPLATNIVNPGGSFSVLPNATINPMTGELDLSSITPTTLYSIIYQLNDACQSFSERTIIIQDTQAPDTMSLPELFGECSVNVPVPVAIDNCADSVAGTTTDSLIYTEQGIYTVSWTFDDGNGNSITQNQIVVVEDTVKPEVICQDITLALDSTGFVVISPDTIDNGSNDACGIESLTLSQDTFNTDDIGEREVILTVVDKNGNEASCTATVTVKADPSSNEALASTRVKISPNPASNYVMVEWESSWRGETSMFLIDPMGKAVRSISSNKAEEKFIEKLTLNGLSSGIYILVIEQNGKTFYNKILKQ